MPQPETPDQFVEVLDTSAPSAVPRSVVAVMAVATGSVVASLYYAQPLLPFIARNLHLSAVTASLIVTLGQVGYAIGLLAIVPLGDLLERRKLVTSFVLASAAALAWLGASSSPASLLPAAIVVGLTSVTAQVLVPFAAVLASDKQRGRVVGTVMSGLLIGILLARTVSGLLAELGSWRLVYFIAAGFLVLETAVLRWQLPTHRGNTRLRYPALLRSVAALFTHEPLLRLRALYGFCSAGAFSSLWTPIAFLLSHRYHLSTAEIGLFGLAGAGGAMAASAAGRLSDRGRAHTTTGITTALLVGSWAAIWAGSKSILLLVVGIIVLDVGVQGLHITNQGEIYGRLDAGARSRLTSAYMVCYFAGAAAGSQLAVVGYSAYGWDGACLVGASFSAIALGTWIARLGADKRTLTPANR